jgi:predicted DsbA family dithiol-disulfide isomerase
MQAQKPDVQIHIVSDTMCPWCFVGKRRLEKALAQVPEINVSVHWRPFQLDSTIPQGGMDRKAYLARKFGPDGAGRIYSRIEAAGAEEGIPFAFDKILRSPNTLDSHRLLHWAEAEGCQDGVAERLFQLYFVEGGDIGDRDVLAKAAAENGMDGAAVRARLDSDEDKASIAGQAVRAREIGIDGVPCFIFNGRNAMQGAHPAEMLAKAIRVAVIQGAQPSA